MTYSRMTSQRWFKAWIYYLFVIVMGTKSARPRFDTSTDMGMVLVPADAEVDSVIFRLRATDQDADFPLVFDITATVTPIVRIDNLPCTLYNKVCQANVILIRRLTAGRLHDFAVRVRDSKGDSNSMQATISVTNATTPRDLIFPHIPALIMVPEDTKPGKELDYILVKSNPWSGKPVYIELWQPKELFTIQQRQTPTHTRGMITLIGELDFETQSMYTLTMYATDPYTDPKKDTRNIAGLQLVVIVKDVQDVPPIFTSAPPLTKINNTIQTGDVILRVHAEDGDKGVPREVTYGLVSEGNPFTPFFNISESTGEIILARPLEQLTQITHVGAPIVLSIVAEEIRRSTDEPPAQATVVEVGLLLGEPGNSPPYFENDNYVAWMDENTELGSSLSFNEPYIAKVHDEDIGKAGVFALKLENNNGTFEIGPTVAERTTNFILTVRDNTLIDYETHKSLRFKIIAQEVGPATNLSTSVPVTIFLRDINDNTPEFDEKSYHITLSENITAGTRVIQVHATDKDTGLFGKVQYTGITGPGKEAFTIDPYTGIITVAMGTTVLDRELTSQLQLSVEARDENGQGLNGIVPLIVNLLDVNDNAPIFEKETYEFTLNDNSTNFTMPAIIRAFDNDAEPPNNQVRYELVHGNYDNKFVLDNTTGELFIREQITKIRNIRNNPYQRFATKFKKTFGQIQDGTTEKTFTTMKLNIIPMISDNETNNNTNITNEQSGIEIIRQKREDQNILFTLTARAYDLGVPHLSGTTQINILSNPATAARIVMFVVPGEHPDPIKTAQTLATITGGRITVQEIRPYTAQENLPNNPGNNLPSPESGKRSIVVAKVEQLGPGASFVDIEKIRAALAANGVGVINDDMKNDETMPGTDPRNNGGTININNTITSEEVTVYRAENKILTWLLTILGLLMIAAIIAVIVCCICPSCPFYMAPRKRRVHSSETLVAHSDNRTRRHVHRKYPMMMDATWSRRKQAWSADPTRNWQFNRRNIKNYGIASLPGDVTRIEIDHEREIPHETHSLHIRDAPIPMFVTEPIRNRRDKEQLYVEDMEPARNHGYSMTNIDEMRQEKFNSTDRRENIANMRDQHYYREGNAEVMRLVTRGIEETAATMHQPHHHRNQPEIIIDQASVHRVDGKDILLRRFIEDQKLRINTQDYHDSMQELERQSMESHQRQKGAIIQQQHQQQQEILLIPEQLEHRHIEELGPDVQRLIIEHGPYENSIRSEIKDTSQDLSARTLLIHGPMTKIEEKSPIHDEKQLHNVSNIHHYSVHDLELARQNALLTRLLLERDRGSGGGVVGGGGVGGIVLDTGSYLETQSLPGQVAAGTQTNQTMATQTDSNHQPQQQQQNRSRSDNDESEEEAKMRRRLKSKKRYDGEPKRIRTLWMKSPIREDERQYEKRTNLLRKKMKDVKDGRKISSIETEVLKEISDSLDETGDTPPTVRQRFADSSNSRYESTRDEELTRRDESSSVEMMKSDCIKNHKGRERSRERTRNVNEPSFRILEREMSSLSKKLSKLVGKKIQESEEESSEVGKLLTSDSKDENKNIPIDNAKRNKKIEIIKAKKSKYNQKPVVHLSTSKEQCKTDKSGSVSSDKIQKPKLNYRKKLSISTGSSELEDVMDKPKGKILTSKVVEGEDLKTKLLKNIKNTRAQFKRQLAIDLKSGKKTVGTRVPDTGKRKEITKALEKPSIKTQKKLIISEDDSDHIAKSEIQSIELADHEKTIQESDSGTNSDRTPPIINDSSMKQSASSDDAVKKSKSNTKTLLELDDKKLNSKIENLEIDKMVKNPTVEDSSTEVMKFDKSSVNILADSSVKIIPKIETMTEDVEHTRKKIDKIISASSELADSSGTLSTIKLKGIVEKPTIQTIESLEHMKPIPKPEPMVESIKGEEKGFEKMVENVTKIIPVLEIIVKEIEKPVELSESTVDNAKDIMGKKIEEELIHPSDEIKIDQENVEPSAAEIIKTIIDDAKDIVEKEIKEEFIDQQLISLKDEITIENKEQSVESTEKLSESIMDKAKTITKEKIEKQLIDQQIISSKDETNIKEVLPIDSHLIPNTASKGEESETLEITESTDPRRQEKMEKDETIKFPDKIVEELNKSLPISSPKSILKITPPTISSDSLDHSIILTHHSIQSPTDEMKIEIIDEKMELKIPDSTQNVIVNASIDQQKFKDAKEQTGNIFTEQDSTIVVIDTTDKSEIPDKIDESLMESEKLQLALEKLSIMNQDDSRSSTPTRVVISRETSFLNSPRRQSIDEMVKSPRPISPVLEKIITTSEQIDTKIKSPSSSGEQTFPIVELKSPIIFPSEISAEQLPSTSIELIDTALDVLEDDSDASSESSTQTAFIARPYGTPRHRRLVRMEHMDNISTDNQLELSKAKHELETTVDKISEQISLGILSEDEIISSDDTKKIMTEKPLDPIVKSPEIVDEGKKILISSEEITVDDNNPDGSSEKLLKTIKDTIEDENICKTEDIQTVKEYESKLMEKHISSDDSLTDVTPIIADKKSSDEISDVNDQTQDNNIDTIPKKVESIIKFDTEQLAAIVDDTSIADQSKEVKIIDMDVQQLPTSQGIILDTINKKMSIKSDSGDESKGRKLQHKSRENIKEPSLKYQQLLKGRTKSLGNIKNLPKKEKSVTMFDKTSDRTIRTRDAIKRQLNVSEQSNEQLKLRKKLEHEKKVPEEKLKDKKCEKEKKIFHKQSVKELNADGKKKSALDHSSLPKKKGKKNLEKITKIGGIKKSSSSSEAEREIDGLDSIPETIPVDKTPVYSDIDKTDEQTVVTSVEEFIEISQPSDAMEVSKDDEIIPETFQPSEINTVDKIIPAVHEQLKSKEILAENLDEMSDKIPSMTPETTTSDNELKIDQEKFNISPKMITKHNKDEHIEAQSRYMAWYKHNREETERRKRERKSRDDENEEPPKWLRKSTRQRWLKMSPEDRKIFGVNTPEVTPLSTRRKIQPLINIESEQLKAIVRQGRKLRRANGDDYDPPVEIFAPDKPPPTPVVATTETTTTTTTKYHYLIQHSEYKYEKITQPFYLHPPPVPNPSPQNSIIDESQFPCTSSEFQRPDNINADMNTEIVVPLPGTNRLRHQQLLEKKSVFDIAYSEAAPSHLRADSTTPPS